MNDRLIQKRAGLARWPAVVSIGLSLGLALLALATVFALAAPRPAAAAGTVGDGSPASCNENNLRAALNGGELVNFNCGPNTVTITVAAPLVITKPTTVDGGGKVVLSGNLITQVFTVAAGSELRLLDLTVHGGLAQNGAAVYNQGLLAAERVRFVRNVAPEGNGSAIYNTAGATTVVTESVFTDNVGNGGTIASAAEVFAATGLAEAAPAAITGPAATIVVHNSEFVGNMGGDAGGGILAFFSLLQVTDSVFENNSAGAGSAIAALASEVHIGNSRFISNTSHTGITVVAGLGGDLDPADHGGAVHILGPAEVVIAGSEFISNTAEFGHGGAVVLQPFPGSAAGEAMPAGGGVTAVVTESRFIANSTYMHLGGAIYSEAELSIYNSEFSGNTAGLACAHLSGGCLASADPAAPAGKVSTEAGGAIFSQFGGLLALHQVRLYSNTAIYGGGLFSSSPTEVQFTQFVSNTALDDAGGLLSTDVLSLTDSTLTGNHAFGEAGGLYTFSSEPSTVRRSLVAANTAGVAGGIYNSGLLWLVNATVSGNSADDDAGGILNSNVLTLTNATVVSNTAVGGEGGNFYADLIVAAGAAPQGPLPPPIFAENSLIAFGRAGGSPNNCHTPLIDEGHNLESGDDCGLTAGTSLTNTNPLITPLVYRGGPTRVHDLMDGSPAIDAANDAVCPEVDQRGAARPVDGDGVGGAACDIGAVEAKSLLPWLYMPFVAKD